jgi:hypothetical protein
MRCRCRRLPFLALAAAGLLALPAVTVLSDDAGKAVKPPAPSRKLAEAFGKLQKAKSYKVSVAIVGGISDNQEHRIATVTVREQYAGEVHRTAAGQLMHVPTLKAFRILERKKGAILADGGWKSILADQKGVRLDRLFSFPEELSRRAMRYVNSAVWLKDGSASGNTATAEESEAGEASPAASGKERGNETEGKTRVAPDREKEAAAKLPRIVRVEAPTQEALKHFIEVENSGCMSAG